MLNLVHLAVGLGGLMSDSGSAKRVVRPIICTTDDTGKTLRIVNQFPAKGAPATPTFTTGNQQMTSKCMTAF